MPGWFELLAFLLMPKPIFCTADALCGASQTHPRELDLPTRRRPASRPPGSPPRSLCPLLLLTRAAPDRPSDRGWPPAAARGPGGTGSRWPSPSRVRLRRHVSAARPAADALWQGGACAGRCRRAWWRPSATSVSRCPAPRPPPPAPRHQLPPLSSCRHPLPPPLSPPAVIAGP